MTIPEKEDRLEAQATLETLRHDEEVFKTARLYQSGPDALTTVPVTGTHSIDLIVFERKRILFVEVKGPKGSLSPLERKIKELINSHPPISYVVVRYE